jgi:hypothetical protein
VARRAEFLAVALAVAAMTQPSVAGTFKMLVAPDNGATVENVKLDATPLKLAAAGPGAWTFAIPPSIATVPMTISLPAPTDDDEPFTMTVNVPFFWSTGSPRTLAAAIAPHQVTTFTLRSLRQNGGDWLAGSLDRRVALNELTRVGWSELWAEARHKNSEDLDIALLFVISSKDLVVNNFVEPTPAMDNAVDMVDGLIQSGSNLFRTPAAMVNAKAAIAAYRDAHHAQEERIVNELGSAIAEGRFADNCDRVRSVNDYLGNLSSDERATIDPTRALQVKNLATLTVCLGHDLQADSGLTTQEAGALRIDAQKVTGQIKSVVPVYVDNVGKLDTRAKLARNGGQDIDNLIAASPAIKAEAY